MTAIGNALTPSPLIGPATAGPFRARSQPPLGEAGRGLPANRLGLAPQGVMGKAVYSRGEAQGAGALAQGASPQTVTAGDPTAPDQSSPRQTSEGKAGQGTSQPVKKPSGETLNQAELALLRELQKADRSVRAHEMAHIAAAGGLAKGGAAFSYQRGPDGQNYAVGGEVQIDTGKEATPQATIQKMQIVRQAALAPADPSPQDQQVAAHATLQIASSMKELLVSQLQSNQPQAQAKGADQGEDGGSRAIIQGLGQQLTGRGASRQSPRAYASYQSSSSPPAPSSRRGIDLQV